MITLSLKTNGSGPTLESVGGATKESRLRITSSRNVTWKEEFHALWLKAGDIWRELAGAKMVSLKAGRSLTTSLERQM